MILLLSLVVFQAAIAGSNDYETAYREYLSLRADQVKAGLEVDPIIAKNKATVTTVNDLEKILAQNKKMKHDLTLLANRNITYSQLGARPRVVGAKVMRAVGPLAAIAVFGSANAAEGTQLEESHSLSSRLTTSTAVKPSSVESFGKESFVQSDSQK